MSKSWGKGFVLFVFGLLGCVLFFEILPERAGISRDLKQGTLIAKENAQKVNASASSGNEKDHRLDMGRVSPSLREFLDSSLPLANRLPVGLSDRIPQTLTNEDIAALSTALKDSKDSDAIRNQVANILRRSNYPHLTDALLAVLDNPGEKPRFRSFAVQHLWQQLDGAGKEEQDRIRAKMHELLADRHVEVGREALLALVRMRDPVGQTTAIGWLTAKEPKAEATRDLAIRCMYDLGLRDQIPTIRSFAHDPNEVTRIAAIVALSQWGDEESREAFKAAAVSSSIRLQRAGKAALERLDQQAHQVPMASMEGAPMEPPDEGSR